MNREIKFRVWDEVQKQMRNVELLPLPSKDILMQFTGLTDKLGKEVYKGDIVRIKDGENEFFVVLWNKAYLQFQFINNNKMFELPDIEEKQIEVISNIYENPELLK